MGTLPTVGTDQATTGHPVAPVCMGSSFKGNCRGMAPPKKLAAGKTEVSHEAG